MKNTVKNLMLLATLLLTANTLTAMKRLRRKLPSLRRSKPQAPTYGASHKSLGLQPTKSFEQKLGSWDTTKGLVSQPQAQRAPKVSLWNKFKTRIRHPKSYKSRMASYKQEKSKSFGTLQNEYNQLASKPAGLDLSGSQAGPAPRKDTYYDTTLDTFTRQGTPTPRTSWKTGKVNVGAIMAKTTGTGYTIKKTDPGKAANMLPSALVKQMQPIPSIPAPMTTGAKRMQVGSKRKTPSIRMEKVAVDPRTGTVGFGKQPIQPGPQQPPATKLTPPKYTPPPKFTSPPSTPKKRTPSKPINTNITGFARPAPLKLPPGVKVK